MLERLAEKETEENEFTGLVDTHCRAFLKEIPTSEENDLPDLRDRVVRVLERLLLRRGEVFVEGVLSETLNPGRSSDFSDLILNDLAETPPRSKITERYPKIIDSAVRSLLAEQSPSTNRYLRRLANSYTLFSFLRQTPDVQSATRKLFFHGTIWVDSTVLLPVFAEQLEEDSTLRRLTNIFKCSVDSGVELRITSGIIQEVNSHMNNAFMCSQTHPSAWRGRTPYLYYQFLLTGAAPAEFRKWLDLFRGSERPEDDLAQFLADQFGMQRETLEGSAHEVPDELRWALDRMWTDAHNKRRGRSQTMDDATKRMLIKHDVETYLGVVALRMKEDVTELGYNHWLLTLDRNAWEIRDSIKSEFRDATPPLPLLSLSFLLDNMTFGPSRSQLGKETELRLPLFLDEEMSESFPHDIIELADEVRRSNEGLPEYVIRRKVRDAIDQARRRRGSLGYSGLFDSHDDE